eukprot:NODE_373_length_9849_cov_0.356205.p3 type:complete len:490 gc:universal NODE_373_length_9849_cov_0.356205:9291-7822(-)
MHLEDSIWLLVLGFAVSFMDAFGMGANDVSHSFGTSVGSGTLTMLQACTIAVFTEFLGATLLGSNNAKTISGLAKSDQFESDPGSLILVMVCALLGSSIWTITTAKYGLPVSSTHSISGAVIGAVLVNYGPEYVNWGLDTGMSRIVLSWFTSPIIAGIVASFIYLLTRSLVLRHKDSYRRGKTAIPLIFAVTILINVYLIMSHSVLANNVNELYQIIASLVACFFSFLFFQYLLVPWMDRRITSNEDLKWYHIFYIFGVGNKAKRTFEGEKDLESQLNVLRSIQSKISTFMLKNVNKNIEHVENDEMQHIHDMAEKFDKKTEELFGYVQVLTAIFASISHGANDVANAIGPLATIYNIHSTKIVTKSIPVPIELLIFGGIAMDIGLFTMGYRLMAVLGKEMTFMSPSRGFAAELGVSLTVISAAASGIPVSTTQCICGATAGIALSNGTLKALNYKLMGKIFGGWIVTVPITGCISGLIFMLAKQVLKV